MSSLERPNQHIMRLHQQLAFPMEDLSLDNTEVLKYMLVHDTAGLDAYAEQLQDSQRFIHMVANRALRLLGVRTQYDPAELYAFSHGFAGFELVSDLVHPPRIYDNTLATAQVARYLVDTRDAVDIAAEREVFEPDEQENRYDPDENEIIYLGDALTTEGRTYRIDATPAMLRALSGEPDPLPLSIHDKREPEKIFTERHTILPEQYPNTYDLLVTMGDMRGETMTQIQLRIAGASLARTLQVAD